MRMSVPVVHLPITDRSKSQDLRISPDRTYFARIYGKWYFGGFTKEWYGWSFTNWGTSGIQLNHIEDLWECNIWTLEHLFALQEPKDMLESKGGVESDCGSSEGR